jgi:hypothetical protein
LRPIATTAEVMDASPAKKRTLTIFTVGEQAAGIVQEALITATALLEIVAAASDVAGLWRTRVAAPVFEDAAEAAAEASLTFVADMDVLADAEAVPAPLAVL